jgi:Type IV leader peptidase family.
MTGTPIVSSSITGLACELLLLVLITGFALYDIRHKRVPNKALAISLPFFLAAPFFMNMAQTSAQCVATLLSAIFGSFVGFGVLLTAALLSKSGIGVGGGDIKLAAAMGFAYGAHAMLGILFIASLLSIPTATISRKKNSGVAVLSLPFVPFLAIGCFTMTIIHILR